uniref:Glutathione S-transferase n=1 Tax=Gammarus pulex TaxID=52641 RepID=A0A181C4Z8_9CRUS|nr:glutathione S-transferase [Gammarus pulex]
MAPILAYWDIRGLAQPIRLLLEYTNTVFEDKYYVCGEGPAYDKSCWFDIKFTLGLDFPNLPYYIDGEVKLTESSAILRYLARQHNLLGTSEEERYRADIMEYSICDFRMAFVRLCYGPNFETAKTKYLKALPEHLKFFSEYLGSRKWFAGENLTYPDFIAYEIFDQVLLLAPSCLDEFPNIKRFQKQFEELEPIKAYLASSRCIKKRLNNRMAMFGSGVE